MLVVHHVDQLVADAHADAFERRIFASDGIRVTFAQVRRVLLEVRSVCWRKGRIDQRSVLIDLQEGCQMAGTKGGGDGRVECLQCASRDGRRGLDRRGRRPWNAGWHP